MRRILVGEYLPERSLLAGMYKERPSVARVSSSAWQKEAPAEDEGEEARLAGACGQLTPPESMARDTRTEGAQQDGAGQRNDRWRRVHYRQTVQLQNARTPEIDNRTGREDRRKRAF